MPVYFAAGSWCQQAAVLPSRRIVILITSEDSAGWDADRVCDDLGPIVEDVLLPPLLS